MGKMKKAISMLMVMVLCLSIGLSSGPAQGAGRVIIKEVYTDKAKHEPGSMATISVALENQTSSSWSGEVTIRIYHLENEIYNMTTLASVAAGAETIEELGWQVPQDDFKGYLVKITLDNGEWATTAIDCSSDVARFPRYGYVAEFPTDQSPAESSAMIKELARDYHISAIQFYDWMWRHDEMIKRTNGQVDDSWIDLFGRELSSVTVRDLIQAANDQNIDSMAYVMSYATREGYDQFGVDPKWGLFQDNDHQSQLNVDFGNNSTYLWLFNPANTSWQNYIISKYKDAINTMGFTGLQMDQMGQRDNIKDYYGNNVELDQTFASLINATKSQVGDDATVTFNMVDGTVDGWAVGNVIENGEPDFNFSEIWYKSDSYKQIVDYIKQVKYAKDKALVLAAYMNYKDNTGTRYEAENASFSNVSVDTDHGGYTGSGFVDEFEAQGDSITFTINATDKGIYPLVFRYANNSGYNATRNVYVDGQKVGTIPFVNQANWDVWAHDAYYPVTLEPGTHQIRLAYDNDNKGAINLDSLTIGTFDDNSIRITDAVFAASGAFHIEIGGTKEHATMLPHEYYASLAKTMDTDLREAMKEYYNFITAYENLLYDPDINFGDTGLQYLDIANEEVSGDGQAGSIYAMYRFKENYDILHLVNLTGETDNEWRNASGQPTVKTELQTKYYLGPNKEVTGVYLATPDSNHGRSKELSYTLGKDDRGTYVAFTVDRLEYWDMIYIKTKPATTQVYEAEDAVKSGVAVNTNHSGYSGAGFVDQFAELYDTVSFNVNVKEEKNYNLKFKYANATGDQAVRAIFVDGLYVGSVYMDNLANWDMWSEASVNVKLRKGQHQVVVLYGDNERGAINLDTLTIN